MLIEQALLIRNNKSLFTFDIKKSNILFNYTTHWTPFLLYHFSYTFECQTPIIVSFHFSAVIGQSTFTMVPPSPVPRQPHSVVKCSLVPILNVLG